MLRKRASFAAILAGALTLACAAQVKDSGTDTGKVAAKSAWLTVTAGEKALALQVAEPDKDYLRPAKSGSLSGAELIRLARAAGFEDFTSPSQEKAGARLI